MKNKGTLYFFCGKMGVGKTTYSIELANEKKAVLFSEDEWLSNLFPGEIHNFNDYIQYSKKIKPILIKHVSQLLRLGISVVMDFPGNTIKQREWFKSIIIESSSLHKLIYLKADDDLCLKHLEKRRLSSPERNQFDTMEVFKQVTSYFQEPSEEEGYNIELINK